MRLRILLSFFFYGGEDMDALLAKHFTPPYPDIFADSGAYSAWSQGTPVDVAKYADWLHRWKHHFTAYANLDVKGNVAAGLANLAYLEGRGLAPVPVFHGGEPWSVLDDFCAAYPYIAIGGIAGASMGGTNPQIGAFLVECFRRAQGRSVLHGFGMTTWQHMKTLPWYSMDSTSWGSGYRFGNVQLFDPRRGAWVKLGYNTPAWRKHADLVRSYGFDPATFMAKTPPREAVGAISALAYVKAEDYLRRLHGPVPMPGQPDREPGTKVHLAHGSIGHLGYADTGVKIHLSCAGSDVMRLGEAERIVVDGPRVYLAWGKKSAGVWKGVSEGVPNDAL